MENETQNEKPKQPNEYNPEAGPGGMQLRDILAMQCFDGVVEIYKGTGQKEPAFYAKKAYELAEAMLQERMKHE